MRENCERYKTRFGGMINMPRPKGSKNKKKKAGRPVGSKNGKKGNLEIDEVIVIYRPKK